MQIKKGNRKLPHSTYIFNMGTARSCPSRVKGLCQVADKCYALKAEKLYGDKTINYRNDQTKSWFTESAESIANDILTASKRSRKKKCKRVRFNESGDFFKQSCVTKLDKIAKILKKHGILTYGFTARKDLNFKGVSFKVKGSFCDNGNNGKAIVTGKNEALPKNFMLCPCDCKTCHACDTSVNIAMEIH